MSERDDHDVTRILEAITAGDQRAGDELFAVVYDELRAIAGKLMRQERSDHTLQPTAVVHEAYLRLFGSEAPRWENRAHFFGTAAEAMRRILVDHARRKLSLKRGGDRQRVAIADLPETAHGELEDILALDQALGRLEARDETMARVVKLRYFAGLSVEQTAEAMEMSKRSVNRAWTGARAWLRREIDRSGRDEPDA